MSLINAAKELGISIVASGSLMQVRLTVDVRVFQSMSYPIILNEFWHSFSIL
jgi:hypothetical protein